MWIQYNKRSSQSALRQLLLVCMPLLPVADRVTAQEPQTKPQCNAVTLKFSLKAGESFEQRIGDLTFKVRVDPGWKPGNGWDFSLEDAAGHDFIYSANPPLRFNPSQILGPGYSLTTRESLKWNREVWFLLSSSDYERVDPLCIGALWPYKAPDPDKAFDAYISVLKKLRLGLLKLRILESDVSPADFVRSATFEVEIIAPSEFRFDPLLAPHPAACPLPFKF